jgi:uncharacterized protein YheU (UPF0270 family)
MRSLVIINGREIPADTLENLIVTVREDTVIVDVEYRANGKAPKMVEPTEAVTAMSKNGYIPLPKDEKQNLALDEQTFAELKDLRTAEGVTVFDEVPETIAKAEPSTFSAKLTHVTSNWRRAGSWPNVRTALRDFVKTEKETARDSTALVKQKAPSMEVHLPDRIRFVEDVIRYTKVEEANAE